MTTRVCKECRFGHRVGSHYWCHRRRPTRDRVTGKLNSHSVPCDHERDGGWLVSLFAPLFGICGPQGRFYTARRSVVERSAKPCRVQVSGDLTVCNTCDLRWDTNDPFPPLCRELDHTADCAIRTKGICDCILDVRAS